MAVEELNNADRHAIARTGLWCTSSPGTRISSILQRARLIGENDQSIRSRGYMVDALLSAFGRRCCIYAWFETAWAFGEFGRTENYWIIHGCSVWVSWLSQFMILRHCVAFAEALASVLVFLSRISMRRFLVLRFVIPIKSTNSSTKSLILCR